MNMRWILASDGIPQEPHMKHWRLSETKTPMMWPTISKIACSENNSDDVEYLDESESSSPPHNDIVQEIPEHIKQEIYKYCRFISHAQERESARSAAEFGYKLKQIGERATEKIIEGTIEKRKRKHIPSEFTPDLEDYEWYVRWDEPDRGLSNLSLPLHPQDDCLIGTLLKEGQKIKFTQSYYADIHESWDCAKLKEPHFKYHNPKQIGSESYWKKRFFGFIVWLNSKNGLWFDDEWREENGFPKDIIRFTTEELYNLYDGRQLKSSIGEETEGQDGWISVEDRLPDAACYCLIYQKDEQVRVSYYTKKRGFEENSLLENELWDINSWVAYWQPLPKPPINTLIKK